MTIIKKTILFSLVLLFISSPVYAITYAEAVLLAQEEADRKNNLQAFPDEQTMDKNQTSVSGNVTSNDIGSISAALTVSASGNYGILSFSSTGDYTYTAFPNSVEISNLKQNESLYESFSYKIIGDKSYEASSNLIIRINGISTSFTIIALNDEATLNKNDITITGNVVSNDTGSLSASLLTPATGNFGSLKFNSSGEYTYTLFSDDPNIQSLGDQGFLEDTFNYQITGENNYIATAILTIRILGNDTNNFLALDDFNSLNVNTTATTTNTVTGNVTSNDKGNKSASLVSTPASQYGVLIMDSSGQYTYTLNNNVIVPSGKTFLDQFQYRILSENGNTTTAYLTISIVGLIEDFYAKDDSVNITANKYNNSLTVSGNVLTNDSGYKTSKLVSSATSDIGSLVYQSDGNYVYTLRNDEQQIRDLQPNESIIDSFEYQIGNEQGDIEKAQLVINVFGSSSLADNVEIEPNNRSAFANNILYTGYNIKGHLQSGSDKDWYSITSEGNETIRLELCPKDSICFDKKAWVLYVFDGSRLTSTIENTTFPLTLTGDDSGNLYDTVNNNHMYLNNAAGTFDSSLIGIIDPCFGDTTGVDIGVANSKKTYYIAISSPLQRDGDGCSSGSVILTKAGPNRFWNDDGDSATPNVSESTTEQYISVFPNSDDQYILSVTRTGANPLNNTSVPATKFNSQTKNLNIPKLRINDALYNVNLALQTDHSRSRNLSLKFTLDSYKKLAEKISADPSISTFNPDNNVIRVSKYIDDQTNLIYSLILLYRPATTANKAWIELIDASPID